MEILQINNETTGEILRQHLARIKPGPVAFTIPDDWAELDNPAQMRLLQRRAKQRGIQLSLITRVPTTRKAAQLAGIPVYSHPEHAFRDHRPNPFWSQIRALLAKSGLLDSGQNRPTISMRESLADIAPERGKNILDPRKKAQSYRSRQKEIKRVEKIKGLNSAPRAKRRPWSIGPLLMGGLLAILLITFGIYILPAATITLTPGREILEVTLALSANPDSDVIDLDENVLPARIVEKTLTESGAITTSGLQQKASGKATGSVTFSNIGRLPVQIPAGTTVSTATGTQVRFRTTQPAALEGGVGTRITVPIEALEEGTQGNVRANTINTVPGSLRLRVRVSNPNGTFGGSSTLVSVVTQGDKDSLLAQVQAQVEGQAADYLRDEIEPGEWMPADAVQTFAMSQVFDQFNDDEAGELQLNLRSLIQGTVVNDEDVKFAMRSVLDGAVPEGAKLVADSVRFFRHPNAQTAGRTIQFTVTVQGQYVTPIDPVEVKESVVGLTPLEAEILLQNRWNLMGPPTIYRDPRWLNTLPGLINRIQVRIEYDNG